VFPKNNHQLIRTQSKFSDDFTYVEAERYREYKIDADVFINIASMQEMNMKTIDDYFTLVNSQALPTYFYCANRISKNLPDGSIINFDDYPWNGMKKNFPRLSLRLFADLMDLCNIGWLSLKSEYGVVSCHEL
jgi:hypothetical protein